MSTRTQRVEQMLRRELADILLRGELRDPRLRDVASVSITGVKVSPDLGHAQVYVDVLADDIDADKLVAGLTAGASAIRGMLGGRIRLKRTPMLHFLRDESIERGLKIESVLAELREQGGMGPEEPKPAAATESEPAEAEPTPTAKPTEG